MVICRYYVGIDILDRLATSLGVEIRLIEVD